MNKVALGLQHIQRSYPQGDETLQILSDVNLTIHPGELVALVGPSGSGKSTLLQIAGLLDQPSAGEVIIAGRACGPLNQQNRTRLRRITVGFIYQFHHLLPELTAQENIALPMRLTGLSPNKIQKHSLDLLERMGLSHRGSHLPSQMSGGEQQRVAIARALANQPRLLLADEPTGNLDPETSETVFRELLDVTRNQGAGALIATHNLELAARMDRMVTLEAGILYDTEL